MGGGLSTARLSLLYGLALAATAAPLAGQASRGRAGQGGAIGVGFLATLGGGWQIEGGEVGYVHRRGNGPLAALAGGIRLGAFLDEGAILVGSRGFVFGGMLAARSGQTTIAEFGDDRHVTALGLDLTLELAGYLGSNSPLPQGSRWAAAALLPGLRGGAVRGADEEGGGGDGVRYALLIGPTLFVSRAARPEVRGLLIFRVEAPLARREPAP